ncbi:protein CURVATURE THYLAKOID 1B, chloroplastic-like isoform X4 [Elaeis guineensis]|uniref:protein CURVATURE THYLAKOID 1B, chloroplastic-like isoform X4 n=1 Tax=Elaeis guineensis var. tenera TaxID=51953 RepID=UPI003C6D817A
MATGDTPAEVVTEVPEIWDRLEDKHAVTSLAFVGAIALWSTSGMISEIDRLPVVPGALELAGIGYTGWFAYRDLVFKPDREALIAKIKNICYDIIGRS